MKLRSQLILAFLACGLVPLVVCGAVGYHNARTGMSHLESEAGTALKSGAEQQLAALRDLKKQQVLSYFDVAQNILTNFTESPTTVDAFREFNVAFRAFRDESHLTDVAKARSELAEYYTGDFAAEFQKQNTGRQPNVGEYVRQLDDDSVALQLAYIRRNQNPLGSKQKLDRGAGEGSYHAVHEKYHPMFRTYLERFGLYDVFLVDAESGDVIYTVFKELDYTTSLKDGPLAQTNIAEAYRRALDADKRTVSLVDFGQYFPSYDAPASFISCPIFDGEKKVAVAIFQVPLDRISQIMAERSGLGETGETVLVGQDFLPRSDSFRDPQNRSVIASFRYPEKASMEAEASRLALQKGEEGVSVVKDYLGHEVISAYGPIEILGLKWAILAKRNTSEALAAVGEMRQSSARSQASLVWWILGISALSSVVLAAVAWWKAESIARPVRSAVEFARQIAAGDLTNDCQVVAKAEVGELIASMNTMRNSLTLMVAKLGSNAGTLSKSSGGLSASATQLATGADETTRLSTSVSAAAEQMAANITTVSASTEEMSANVRTVAAAIEEMTASIAEVAQNADRAADVAAEAAQLTEVSSARIGQLGLAATEIGKVIEVIQDIAEQTNLLALNATIEAARAGDAGKGFAVVATEVKELARQTATATDDIRARIQAIQGATSEAITAMSAIEEVIRNVNDVSRTIASAVEEQRITTSEISRSVTETTLAVDSVSRSVSESAMASREITSNMSMVDVAARQTSQGAMQARDAGEELLAMAEELQGLVRQFRVEAISAA